MAFIQARYCAKCNKQTRHIDGECEECLNHFSTKELEKWNGQSLEDKIKNLRERIERLERGEIRYR